MNTKVKAMQMHKNRPFNVQAKNFILRALNQRIYCINRKISHAKNELQVYDTAICMKTQVESMWTDFQFSQYLISNEQRIKELMVRNGSFHNQLNNLSELVIQAKNIINK